MPISFLVCILFGLQPGSPASSNHVPAPDKIPIVTVCEALTHASEYDGKIVSIRDRAGGTDEWSAFRSDGCPGALVTDGKTWPSSIVWTMPSDKNFIIHPANFSFDWDSQKRLDAEWRDLSKKVPDHCIVVTYTGMFEIWSKAGARKPIRRGWMEFSGFGHLNGWGAQLVLRSADAVSAIPGCK